MLHVHKLSGGAMYVCPVLAYIGMLHVLQLAKCTHVYFMHILIGSLCVLKLSGAKI